jgi:L-rhamnonate dehydratase
VRITNIRATVPRGTDEPRDWRTAMAQIAITVETDEGLSGLGVGGGGAAGIHIVDTVLRPALIGQDSSDLEGLWARMYRATLPFGRKGLAVMALSGVDLALWDLAGRRAGKPVFELLGGLKHQTIPAYASIDAVVTDEVERGFRDVKLHLQRLTGGPQAAIEAVRAARETIGPDVKLYVDAFLAWDVETTLRLAEAFVPYRVEWIEEPISPDDLDGYAELVRRSPVPIAGGEHEYGVHGFRELLDRKAHVILQPDASWCGGMTQLRKIYALAAERGVWVVPHRGAEVWGLHAVAALGDRPLAESGRPWITWLRGEPPIVDGQITPTNAPGFGVELASASIS